LRISFGVWWWQFPQPTMIARRSPVIDPAAVAGGGGMEVEHATTAKAMRATNPAMP